MTPDESVWIARAAAGDKEAYEALLAPRWARMVRIALRIMGEMADAEDVAQDAALRLWQQLPRFRVGESLDGWIYRMVVNLALDSLRRRRARPLARRVVAPEHAPLVDQRPGPATVLLARELERALQDVTEDLPPRQKAVFVLCRVEGLSAPEVANLLGVTPSTVRNTLFQARAAIAERLRRRCPELLGVLESEP